MNRDSIFWNLQATDTAELVQSGSMLWGYTREARKKRKCTSPCDLNDAMKWQGKYHALEQTLLSFRS